MKSGRALLLSNLHVTSQTWERPFYEDTLGLKYGQKWDESYAFVIPDQNEPVFEIVPERKGRPLGVFTGGQGVTPLCVIKGTEHMIGAQIERKHPVTGKAFKAVVLGFYLTDVKDPEQRKILTKRIVDFLDGVRPSPRQTTKRDVVNATGPAEREQTAGAGGHKGAAGNQRKAETTKRRGLFTRLEQVWVGPAAARPEESGQAVAGKANSAVAVAPSLKKPDRLRTARGRSRFARERRSGFGWFSIAVKLAAGVGVAMLAVHLQETMPRWDFRQAGRLVESRPPPLPKQMPIVTGSVGGPSILAAERRVAGFAAAPSGGALEIAPGGAGMVLADASISETAGYGSVTSVASRRGLPIQTVGSRYPARASPLPSR